MDESPECIKNSYGPVEKSYGSGPVEKVPEEKVNEVEDHRCPVYPGNENC